MLHPTDQTERTLTIVYQLRIYTPRTAEALQDYATVHWPRHIPSLRAFGVSARDLDRP
jgi:hypothetical protein